MTARAYQTLRFRTTETHLEADVAVSVPARGSTILIKVQLTPTGAVRDRLFDLFDVIEDEARALMGDERKDSRKSRNETEALPGVDAGSRAGLEGAADSAAASSGAPVSALECPSCPRKFVSPNGLAIHRARIHSAGKPSDQVESARALLGGRTTPETAPEVGGGVQPLRSSSPAKLGPSSGAKKPEARFECLDCARAFKAAGHLRMHREAAHAAKKVDGPIRCSECGDSFNTPSALGEHHRREHLKGEQLRRARREAGLA